MKEDVDERSAGESMERKRSRRLCPTRIAVENNKRRPIALNPAPEVLAGSLHASSMPVVEGKGSSATPPPRVRKPSRIHDQVFAPTPDLEGHRAELRRVFGTLSDEFSQTMLGKLDDSKSYQGDRCKTVHVRRQSPQMVTIRSQNKFGRCG
jgi:hypothetical protein